MLLGKITAIRSDQHYLARPSIHYDSYISSLNSIVNALSCKATKAKINDLIEKKLQISSIIFNEPQYIQTACELTVMSGFLENSNFVYEDKVTPPKDVDFSIAVDGKKYNIEVKCASYPEEKKTDEIAVAFTNRMPTREMRDKVLEEICDRLSGTEKTIREIKNLDNTMKDFLESTQGKVQNSRSDEINILAVCCNNEIDMQNWRGYLFSEGGFFTEKSIIPHGNFDRVDFVLLTNIYNRHFRYFDDDRVSNHWRLSSSFNLLYPNKYSKLASTITPQQGEALIGELNKILPNHNIEFEKYMKNIEDIPSGEVPEMKSILGIAWYSDKFKSVGEFYFQRSVDA